MSKVRVDVLVFEGCPHLDVTVERVRAALSRLAATADVNVVQVEDDQQAKQLRFLGSPTVQVDGIDVEPTAAERDDYALQCRVYLVNGRLEGAPPVEWILAALSRAA